MSVESFLISFRQFYFLTQSYDFALHGGHFWQYSSWCHFSNMRCFFERFLHRISIMCLEIRF